MYRIRQVTTKRQASYFASQHPLHPPRADPQCTRIWFQGKTGTRASFKHSTPAVDVSTAVGRGWLSGCMLIARLWLPRFIVLRSTWCSVDNFPQGRSMGLLLITLNRKPRKKFDVTLRREGGVGGMGGLHSDSV